MELPKSHADVTHERLAHCVCDDRKVRTLKHLDEADAADSMMRMHDWDEYIDACDRMRVYNASDKNDNQQNL